MRLILSLFTIMVAFGAYSQQCDCPKMLDSVKIYMEKNYAGAKDKLTSAHATEYKTHNEKYRQLATISKTETHCLYTIDRWLRYFKDRHIYTSFNFGPEKLKAITASTQVFRVDGIDLNSLSAKGPLEIEGIYHTADTMYRVAVIKVKGFHQYAAVILHTKAPEWSTGQMKFEIRKLDAGKYDAIWYNRAHHPSFGDLDFTNTNGLTAAGWIKEGSTQPAPTPDVPLFEEENKQVVFYKQLDEKTGYLRIQSFGGNHAAAIDSVVNANKDHLAANPYLLIDVRGNGGGSDFAYRPLKKWIYTQPVKMIGLDIRATPDNVVAWENILTEPDIPEDYKDFSKKMLKEVRSTEKDFLSIYADETDSVMDVLPAPKKVGILVNSRCGSTTEQFLLEAMQSKKVTIFGQPTMGVLDYGNVREKKYTCPDFTLHYAVTRSRRIDAGQGIDNIGIQPDVRVDFEQKDWLETVVKKLK